MNNRKVLLVDDDPSTLEFLSYNLIRKGFVVKTAANGTESIEIAKGFCPDIIILDWMMPEMDGITTCREFRKDPSYNQTIISFLTAKDDDFSRIEGFDAGADDYIHKSIKPLVFVAKVEALIRRKHSVVLEEILHAHDLVIYLDKKIVTKAEKKINLTKIEFNLLLLFLSNRSKVFARKEIYDAIWGQQIIVGDRTLDVHIRNLRKKLGDKIIHTRKGLGYMLGEESN